MKSTTFAKGVSLALIVAVGLWFPGFTPAAQAQEHPERAKFHADVAHALLDMTVTLNLIEAYRAQGAMQPNPDEVHAKAANGFRRGLELFGVKVAVPEEAFRAKFHADVAHALLGMDTTLDHLAAHRVEGTMPAHRDDVHEQVAHGFRHALELFGVKVAMPEHPDRSLFHADVAHALLAMTATLNLIEAHRAEGTMPPNRDAKHERVAHGFLKPLQLFGVPTSMPSLPSK